MHKLKNTNWSEKEKRFVSKPVMERLKYNTKPTGCDSVDNEESLEV